MCEKLVPKKGTFFCADKVSCPLRQHLFIPHGWRVLCRFTRLMEQHWSVFQDARTQSLYQNKNNIIISPLGERRNFLANVMSLEISERGKINCLNYFIFRRLLELFKIFPLRDSTHLTSLVREEILFYSRL